MSTSSPPVEAEAEQLLIGAIAIKPEIVPEALSLGLRPNQFVDLAFRRIYSTAVERHLSGQPCDVTILARELRDDPLFRTAEGGVTAMLIEAGQAAVTTAHWKYHAGLITDAASKRHVLAAVEQAVNSMKRRDGREVISDLSVALYDLQRDYCCGDDDAPREAFAAWESSVLNRERPAFYQWAPYGTRLGSLRIGEKHIGVIGAPPGNGKTALVSQIVFEALRFDGQDHLKALIANVEMGPHALWDRQLARLTGIGSNYIQHRDYDAEALPRLQAGIEELRLLMPRIEFMAPPFTLERLTERADAFEADIVVVDYAQRFDYAHRSSDQRAQANAVMDCCRRLADAGRAVIVISAVNRAGYGKEASLSSFRESSELEYGADAAYLLVRDEQDSQAVTLKCVKNRHGSTGDVRLLFDGAAQLFTEDPAEFEWNSQ